MLKESFTMVTWIPYLNCNFRRVLAVFVDFNYNNSVFLLLLRMSGLLDCAYLSVLSLGILFV